MTVIKRSSVKRVLVDRRACLGIWIMEKQNG